MTNKIKISRELAERIVKDGAVSAAQIDQLRALLANPQCSEVVPQCSEPLRTQTVHHQVEHTAVGFLERMLKGSGDDRLAAWQGEIAMLLEHIAENKHQGEPVAWLHIMHMEEGQTNEELTKSPDHPFGTCGVNYDPSYTVESIPLFAKQPAPVSVSVLYARIKELEAQSLAYYERAKVAESQLAKANDWSHIAPVAASPSRITERFCAIVIPGWICSREPGHTGPCAATPDPDVPV